MNYEYEKLCAARSLLEDVEVVLTWLYWRRRNLIADLVALEQEQDEVVMKARRNRIRQIRLREEQERKRFAAMDRKRAERKAARAA